MIQQKKRTAFTAADLLRRLCAAWMLSAVIGYLSLSRELQALSSLQGLAQRSFEAMCCMTGILFGIFCALAYFLDTRVFERWMLTVSFATLWGCSMLSSYSPAYLCAGFVVLAVLLTYSFRGQRLRHVYTDTEASGSRLWWMLAAAAAVLFFLTVSFWTVGRVLTFSSPTYDFGIFSQMFHHMRTTGIPNTTLERDGLLSHFDVHVSPIYYLLLPIYILVPTPATLQVLQAAVLASAIIPLWKLTKLHGLSGFWRFGMCLLLLLYPAYSGGTGYDIHENAFLTPLLLWLLYSIDHRRSLLTGLFTVLTLFVKEDAAVYVAIVGLWLILRSVVYSRKQWSNALTGCLITAAASVWFILVTGYLAQHGDGVMTYRYQNFMYDSSGSLVTVIKAVLLCPVKALYECVDTEKLTYIALTMCPLLGLPLVTRRYERLVLLIPYLLVNLMSDYPYQHDIFFQYSFGSTACLMYLTLVNLADLCRGKLHVSIKALPMIISIAVSAALFSSWIIPTAKYYPTAYVKNQEHYTRISQMLDSIPEDATVSATTFYTPNLSQRDVIYDVGYASLEHLLGTEYIVLNPSASSSFKAYGGYERLISVLEQEGYTLIGQLEGYVEIYKKTQELNP